MKVTEHYRLEQGSSVDDHDDLFPRAIQLTIPLLAGQVQLDLSRTQGGDTRVPVFVGLAGKIQARQTPTKV